MFKRCLVCLALVSAARSPAFAEEGSLPPQPIRLGATLALSGPLGYMGHRELTGMQLAVEELNRRGGVSGRPLELLVDDNGGDAKAAAAGMTKLLNVDHIDVALSAFTHVTQAIKGPVNQSGKLLLYESALRSIAEEHPKIFRDYYDAGDSGRAIVPAVLQTGARRVGYLHENNDSCLEFILGAKSGLTAVGAQTVADESFSHGETDFRALLLRLKARGADALVFCIWRDTPLVMRQLKDLRMLHIPTFQMSTLMSPENDTPELRRLYAENKTVSSAYGFTEDSATLKQRAFISAYTERFKTAPSADSAFTYDDIYVLAEALRPCTEQTKVDQDCLAAQLIKTDYDGAAGRLKFNEQRISSRPVFSIRFEKDRWVRAAPSVDRSD